MTGLLSLVLALASLLLLALYVLQRRELRALGDLSRQLQRITADGAADARIDITTDHPDVAALVASANQLLDRAVAGSPGATADGALFSQVVDRMHEIVLIHTDTIRYANQQFAALLGVGRETLVGRRFADLVQPEQAGLVADHLRRRLAGELVPERFEADLVGSQGQLSRLEVSVASTQYEGQPALLVTGVEVIPTQALPMLGAQALLEGGRSRARNALDSLGEALLTTDSGGVIDYANPAAARLLGAEITELRGQRLEQVVNLIDETDRKLLSDPVEQVLNGAGSAGGLGRRAVLLSRPNGVERSIDLRVAPIRSRENAAEEITGAVLLLQDVTELRGMARQMSYQATHDALTGLINRPEFERRLAEVLESAHRGDGVHVLCYLDLDRFKSVNDTSGHQAGDAMLREVAKLMRKAVRDSDSVARLGGDEFAMLLPGCPLDKARQIADDLARAVADFRFVWKDRLHAVGVSVGLLEIARDSGTLAECLAAADSACYVAKKQGGAAGNVAVYSARDEVVARQTGEIQWLQTLQTAIRENHFRLYCQPIVAAFGDSGRGPSMEVLVRLADDQGRELAPLEFVRAAERYRLMGLVDRWIVQTTLTALGRGALELPGETSIAINISGQTLADAQFLEFVVECLDRTGVAPAQVCFEIAESAVSANIEQARRFAGVLHGMGCQFALDDFGSNIGSFSSLKNLPMDYLKIDGAFIRNLARDSVNQEMVAAMIRLARTLNFKVIAEQVEDAASAEAARSMGVDFLQGYAIGRPAPMQLAA